ncbi:hypothetical protein LX32DRAFT_636108 [Colletotrichum zoysiae]|uniref:Protein kinase domain-containing protein n=1 Tax=Colletotrichum zoysiae TaxID=1216348 RepID=A0AAD9HNV3_9PEZI|nr:hypothetical protein LX32DRAFT_636108 [Colletotrichum zoysiae]
MDTALGAFGALDVVLRRSMEGLSFWQRIKGSSDSAKHFSILLEWQRTKLQNWKDGWSIESNKDYRQDHRFRTHEQLIMKNLRAIHSILDDFANLDAPEPLLTQSNCIQAANHLGAFSGPRDGGNSKTPSLPSTQGIKWVLQEDRLKYDLDLLTKMIDNLVSFIPPPRHDPARTLILSDLITTRDPNDLVRISRADIDDPLVASLAWIKSFSYHPDGAYVGNHQLQSSLLVPIDRNDNRTKFMARYQGELVLVEKKDCTAAWNQVAQLNILKVRIDKIVDRLQTPKQPTGLRTLPCQGSVVIRDKPSAEDKTTWTYNIVYRADYPRFTSLRNLLSQKKTVPGNRNLANAHFPLEKQFILAQTLARAIMYLHLADWLHKAVRSENVVFFINDENRIQTHLPYLVGFEYSRLDVTDEQTENVEFKPDHRFYRHPEAMVVPISGLQQPLGGPGRYSKVYDIYSMGVVLLEIGRFMSARSITEEYGLSKLATLVDIRNVFVEKAIPDLRSTMGEAYAGAVLTCLDGSLDMFVGHSLHRAFYEKVVCQLDTCLA